MKRLLAGGGLLVALFVVACVGDGPSVSDPAQSSSSSSSGAATSSSSSSGGSSTSSSSGAPTTDAGTSSSSGGDAGDAAVVCTPPLPTDIDVGGAQCGALPLPAPPAILPEDVGVDASFHGGTITPGQYVLVRLRTNGAVTTQSSRKVYAFDADGAYSLHTFDNLDTLGDTELQWGGTFTTSGSILTIARTCPDADTGTFSYSVDVDGCDVLLELGKGAYHWTFKLRREP